MSNGFKLGMLGDLLLDTASYDSPTWIHADQAKDVNVNIEDGEVDLNSRVSIFELVAQGKRKISLEFDYTYYVGNAVCLALLTAFWNKTPVDMAALDGPIADNTSRGFRIPGCVISSNKGEALTEGQKISFVIKPTLWIGTQRDPTPIKSDGANLSTWDFT